MVCVLRNRSDYDKLYLAKVILSKWLFAIIIPLFPRISDETRKQKSPILVGDLSMVPMMNLNYSRIVFKLYEYNFIFQAKTFCERRWTWAAASNIHLAR